MLLRVYAVIAPRAQRTEWRWQRGPSGAFVAWCDALGLTVEGDTFDDMVDAIRDAQESLFLSLFKDGDLDRFLRERRDQ